jgi:hypothetical protein
VNVERLPEEAKERLETWIDGYSEITGYHAGGKEAVVYWWRAVQGASGPRADSLRSVVTGL